MSESTPAESSDDLFDPSDAEDSDDSSPEWSARRASITFRSAVSLSALEPHMGRHSARVILFMGEVGAGKSTLLVELWTSLMLDGHLNEDAFAASLTPLAFERRAYLSRNESGAARANTPRTQAEDDGWLHLRMASSTAGTTDLILSDMTGERFERVRQGKALMEEFDFIPRVDMFVVVIDGGKYKQRRLRETLENNAQRLILSVRDCASVDEGASITLLLTKSDLLQPADADAYSTMEGNLLRDAQQVDAQSQTLQIAARPDQAPPFGLDLVMARLRETPKRAVDPPRYPPSGSFRAMGRFRR